MTLARGDESTTTNWSSPGVAYGSELGSIARNLAEGRGFSSPFERGEQPTSWFAPFMPAAWAALFWMTGVFSPLSLWIILTLQVIASSLACGVYWQILRHFRGKLPGLPHWLPLVVASVIACWPEAFLMIRKPWYFTYQELAVAILFLQAMKWIDHSSFRSSVTLGTVAGVAALINPVPLGLFLWSLLMGVLGRPNQARVGHGILAGATCLLVISPWLIRNTLVFDQFAFVRTNLGVELRQGNGPQGTPKQTRASLHPALNTEELDRYREWGELKYSQWCLDQAVQAMKDDMGLTVRRTLERIWLYWSSDALDWYDWNQKGPWWNRPQSEAIQKVVKVMLALIPLAALAFLGTRRRLDTPYAPLFAGILILTPLPYYLTHVTFSYSYLVKPYLLLLLGLWFGTWLALCSDPNERRKTG